MLPKINAGADVRATKFRKLTWETITMYRKRSKFIGPAIMALALSTTAIARDKLPETSYDGLTLTKHTKH